MNRRVLSVRQPRPSKLRFGKFLVYGGAAVLSGLGVLFAGSYQQQSAYEDGAVLISGPGRSAGVDVSTTSSNAPIPDRAIEPDQHEQMDRASFDARFEQFGSTTRDDGADHSMATTPHAKDEPMIVAQTASSEVDKDVEATKRLSHKRRRVQPIYDAQAAMRVQHSLRQPRKVAEPDAGAKSSIEEAQSSSDIVFIDGKPCNGPCQSYMAFSRRVMPVPEQRE